MSALADALVYAVTYINLAAGDDDRADDDCGALESVMGFLRGATADELEAVREAVDRAIKAEQASGEPRLHFLQAYEDLLETIQDG